LEEVAHYTIIHLISSEASFLAFCAMSPSLSWCNLSTVVQSHALLIEHATFVSMSVMLM